MLSLSGCLLQHNDPQFPIKRGYLYLRAVNILPSIALPPASKLEEALLLKLVVLAQPCWQNIKLMFVFLLYTEKDIMKSQGIKRNGFFTRLHYKVCNIFAIFYFPLNHYMSV